MQSSCALPRREAQGATASLTRLVCTTSITVVRMGAPFSCAARGSTRRMCASGAALTAAGNRSASKVSKAAKAARGERGRVAGKWEVVRMAKQLSSIVGTGAPALCRVSSGGWKSSDDFRDHRVAAEAHGVAVTQLAPLAGWQPLLVDEGAVRAALVFQLETSWARRGEHHGVPRGGGGVFDRDVELEPGVAPPDHVPALIERIKPAELIVLVAHEKAGEHARRVLRDAFGIFGRARHRRRSALPGCRAFVRRGGGLGSFVAVLLRPAVGRRGRWRSTPGGLGRARLRAASVAGLLIAAVARRRVAGCRLRDAVAGLRRILWRRRLSAVGPGGRALQTVGGGSEGGGRRLRRPLPLGATRGRRGRVRASLVGTDRLTEGVEPLGGANPVVGRSEAAGGAGARAPLGRRRRVRSGGRGGRWWGRAPARWRGRGRPRSWGRTLRRLPAARLAAIGCLRRRAGLGARRVVSRVLTRRGGERGTARGAEFCRGLIGATTAGTRRHSHTSGALRRGAARGHPSILV